MTDYARHNADKCCLKFKLVNEFKSEFDPLIIDSLFRDANKALAFNLTIATNENLKSKYNENTHRNYLANVREAKSKLSAITEYQEAIRFLMEYQKMSQQELADACGISLSTLKRYLRKEGDMSKPGKKAAVRLCIGLQLNDDLAILLCEIIGHTFNERDEVDKTYLMVFQTMQQHHIKKVETVLKQLGKENLLDLAQ